MSEANRDQNRVTTLTGTSDVDQETPINIGADPITKELLVQATLNDNSTQYALKLTEVGDVSYIAQADPGTTQASATWRAKKLDQTSGLVITWADGDTNFDNVATDLTALTYS